MEKYEKFDEKKTAEERLKRLVATGIPFDYVQKKESIDGEWVVETTLYLYYPGYMRKFTGLAAMSKTNPIYGSSALQFASTASYGRAISMSGVIDDLSCSIKEEIEAAKEIQKEARQDVIKEVSEPVAHTEEQVIGKMIMDKIKTSPVVYKEPEAPLLVIKENNTAQLIPVDTSTHEMIHWDSEKKCYVSDKTGEPVMGKVSHDITEDEQREVVPEEIESLETLKALGTEVLKEKAKGLKIPFEEYPRRKTAGILAEMIMAQKEGRLDEHLRQFCIAKGDENVEKGINWDYDFPAVVIKRHRLDEYFCAVNGAEITEPRVEEIIKEENNEELPVKESGPDLDNSKVQELIKGWGDKRDFSQVGAAFNELNSKHKMPAGDVIDFYKKMAIEKLWKYSDVSVFLAEAKIGDVELFLERLL